MKYQPKKRRYIASNVVLNVSPLTAYSYGYWCFLRRINGKLVFNNYPYSISTQGHQRKVLAQLRRMGIEIDLFIEAPRGLGELTNALEYCKNKQVETENIIFAPRKRLKTKDAAREKLDLLIEKEFQIQKLIESKNMGVNV